MITRERIRHNSEPEQAHKVLTPRQWRAYQLLMMGFSDEQIADRMHIEPLSPVQYWHNIERRLANPPAQDLRRLQIPCPLCGKLKGYTGMSQHIKRCERLALANEGQI